MVVLGGFIRVIGFRVSGVCWGNIGVMEKKIETIMGCIGLPHQGLAMRAWARGGEGFR